VRLWQPQPLVAPTFLSLRYSAWLWADCLQMACRRCCRRLIFASPAGGCRLRRWPGKAWPSLWT